MATFADGEGGLSVRTKINNVLQHADGTSGELVINDAGGDVDFRVESDTNANALFVDGATGNVGLGTSTPGSKLEVVGNVSIGSNAGVGTLTVRSIPIAINQSATTARFGTGNDSYDFRIINNITGTGGSFLRLAGPTDTAAYMAFETAGAERMRLDAKGNMGLGVTPSAWNAAWKAAQVGAYGVFAAHGSVGAVRINSNAFDDGAEKYIGSTFATKYEQYEGQHKFFTAPSGTAGNAITFTNAMTLDTSGNLLVGTTGTVYSTTNSVQILSAGTALNLATPSASSSVARFFTSTYTLAGYINVSGGTTTYNTTSDYRLKENIQPMQGALAKIELLNPVTYTWKADGSQGQGFIAHELQAVVPDCVTGQKDAVGADGNDEYQGVDASVLVATLVKAIQEQQAMIADLKDRLDAANL